MQNPSWTLTINDSLPNAKALVGRAQPSDSAQLTGARATILAALSKLPGPNVHVSANGAGTGEPMIFVGTGDPNMTYRTPAAALAPVLVPVREPAIPVARTFDVSDGAHVKESIAEGDKSVRRHSITSRQR